MSTDLLAALPPNPPTFPLLSDQEIGRLRGKGRFYVPNAMGGVQADCITCEGEGEFRWYEGNTDKVVTYVCDCIQQWQLYAVFTSANIPYHLQRLGWSDLDGTEEGAINFVFDYLDALKWNIRTGMGMFLYGGMGTGKSSLSALLLKRIISEGYDGYYTTFDNLVDMYTAGWRDNDERDWFHRRIKGVRVLVIDDLGKEGEGRKNVIEPLVDEVIRHRTAQATPTIITSNEDARWVAQKYKESVYSLLTEAVKTYEFTGENYRTRANLRKDQEMSLKLQRPVVIS